MKLSSINVTDKVTAYLIDGLTQLEMIEALKRDGVKRELSTIEKIISKLKKKHGAKTLFQLGFKLGGRNENRDP
ncbi:TPA: hypothetical protein JRW62_002443 [Elizabethkingia meningoseptica]|nr:hypothetical protein [Elizabethkingia meningoseptica]